jgi:uncharacterized protein YcbK (DUF882 family)
MRRLGYALLVALLFQGRAGAQEAAGADEASENSEEGEAPGPQEKATEDKAPAAPDATAQGKKTSRAKKVAAAPKPKVGKDGLHWSRKPRKGAKLMGAVVPEERLRAAPPPRPSGNIHLYVLATHESLKVNIYNEDGSYNIEALQAASHLLRCKRTGAEKEIEPRLFTVLSTIYDHFGEKRLEVVSGYRNQRRTTSFHFRGSASDIRIEGVKIAKIRDYADSLDAGGMGVGLYPRAGFVHVDVRPLPSYRWIDYAKSDPDNPDKRPPRGWKRKKLTS